MRHPHARPTILVLLAVLAGLVTPRGRAAVLDDPIPTLPQGPFDNAYTIEVRLDAARMVIEGTERVTFKNPGSAALASIPFHLYPNAWSSTATTWVREGRAEAAILERGAADGGYLRVDSIFDGAGADLRASTTIDETLMHVNLPAPLAPGATATFVVGFTTKLPRVVARMGKIAEHVDAMQWFPKLCAFRDGAFVAPQFHNPSEFFADFGTYEVTITLPRRYEIEATGVRKDQVIDDAADTQTVTFTATAVHDFAWTADPNFVRHTRKLEGGPEIVLLSQPFLEPKADLVLDAAERALARTGEWFFPYPYPRLVIDTVPFGRGGGMEYPALFTISAGAPEALGVLRRRSDDPVGVTVHEFCHQYFQGMIATDEYHEAWLDEGLTTYVAYKILEDPLDQTDAARVPGLPLLEATLVFEPLLERGGPFGPVAGYRSSPFFDETDTRRLFGFSVPRLALDGRGNDRFRARMATYAPFARDTVLRTTSWDVLRIGGANAYRSTAYSKPVLLLRTLEGLIGWDRMRAMLRAWARRHAFSHPTTDDFVALANEFTEGRFQDLIHAAVDGSAVVDWSVDEVRDREVKPASGFLPQRKPGDPIEPAFARDGADDAAPGFLARMLALFERVPAEGAAPAAAPRLFEAEVLVRNRGTLAVPVDVELRYADGSAVRIALDPEQVRAPWTRLTPPPRAARIVAAIVDPDRKVALDLDFTNNALNATPDDDSGRAFASFYAYWVQSCLSAVSWFS